MQKKSNIKLKRFYIPGMISLIFFPILCVYYITISTIKTEERAITVIMNPLEGSDVIMTNYASLIPERNFRQIILNGMSYEDKMNLGYAEHAIRRMINDRDTINGINFTFNKNVSYGILVSALNVCLKENAKQYVLKGNDIWVFYNLENDNFPSKSIRSTERNYSLENDVFYMESKEDALYNKKKKVNFIIERIRFLVLPFILFVILIIRAIRKITTIE